MRRTVVLAATLSAAFASAPAHAATLPPASRPGVTVSRSGGSAVVTFTPRAYRPFAGRRIIIDCTSSRELSPVAAPPKSFLTRLRFPSRPAPIRLKPQAGTDVCAFDASTGRPGLLVALSSRARRFIADAETTTVLLQLVVGVTASARTHASWPAYADLPKSVRAVVAELSSPSATPRGKRFGYYSDARRRMAIVGVSATGRRFTFSIDGEDASTNVLGVQNNLGAQGVPPSGTLPVGAFPPAGTPLPDATVAGVTAAQTGGQVDVAFSGSDAEAAYSQLAGKRVLATCTRTVQPILGIVLQLPTATAALVAPDQPSTLHLDLGSGTYSTCALRVAAGSPVLQVAVGEAGRAPLADGLTGQAIDAVARRAAGDGTGDYASAATLSSSFAGAVTELASPTDTPTDRRIGVFSSGKHLALVGVSLTGRRLYEDVAGDVVTTNLQSITSLTPIF